MKSFRFVLIALVIAAMPAMAVAATLRAADQLSVASPVNDDIYVAGSDVSVTTEVAGDIVAAGRTVFVSASTTESVLAAAGTVQIVGPVGDDVRVIGGTVNVQSQVRGDVVAAGGEVHLLTGSVVGKDAVMAAGEASLDGVVMRDVRIVGGRVFLNGRIEGSAKIDADEVILGPAAVIAGDFVYSSGKQATITNGARVLGKTTYTFREAPKPAVGAKAMSALFSIVSLFVVGLVIHAIGRRASESLVSRSTGRFWQQMLRGLVTLVVTPVAAIIALITVVGAPLGVIAIFAYIVALVFSYFFAPVVVGTLVRRLWAKDGVDAVNWKTILLGAAIFGLAGFVPVIGPLAKFALMLVVLGSLLHAAYEGWVERKPVAAV